MKIKKNENTEKGRSQVKQILKEKTCTHIHRVI